MGAPSPSKRLSLIRAPRWPQSLQEQLPRENGEGSCVHEKVVRLLTSSCIRLFDLTPKILDKAG